jgi:hypothetical protein
MTLLRRIQNISPYDRWGVRNVSNVRIFWILRNLAVSVSPTVKAGVEMYVALNTTACALESAYAHALELCRFGEPGPPNFCKR